MLDVLEQQQRLTKNQWKIISAAVLGDMLDFFDYGLIAVENPAWASVLPDDLGGYAAPSPRVGDRLANPVLRYSTAFISLT
jgi:hypothetical protein